MLMTEGQRKNRASRLKKETADIAAGLGIVIFSILVFINPDRYRLLFPVIFLMAAGINLVNGMDRMSASGGRRAKKRRTGFLFLGLAAALLLMALFSAASIVWG